MNKLIPVFAALMFGAVTLPAFAQANTPRIDQRQMNQDRRIDQGCLLYTSPSPRD